MKYEILTPNGFKPFDYISKKYVNSYYILTFQNLNTNEIFELKLTR